MCTRQRFAGAVLGVAAALLLGGAAPARAAMVASHFGNPDAGTFSGLGPGDVAASSFTTDAGGGVLNSATLSLFSQNSPPPSPPRPPRSPWVSITTTGISPDP
jgi:hypothetical protein